MGVGYTTNTNQAWTLVANPDTNADGSPNTQPAQVSIKIAGQLMGNYTIPAGGRITPTYPNILNGPVEVISDKPVLATQRVLYGGSFNEFVGI
jgi:hypothetical protein